MKSGVRLDDGTAVAVTAPALVAADTRLLVAPKEIRRPRLGGDGAIRLDRDAGLAAGDTLAWREGSVWKMARVLAAEGASVRLDGAAPPKRRSLYRMAPVGRPSAGDFLLNEFTQAVARAEAGGFAFYDLGDLPRDAYGKSFELDSSYPDTVYVLGRDAAPIAVVGEGGSAPGGLVFDGAPGDLAAGQWLVLEDADGRRVPARIARIALREDDFTLVHGPVPATFKGPAVRIEGAFDAALAPDRHDIGQAPVAGTRLTLDAAPATLLKPGRLLVLESGDAADPDPVLLTVVAVDAATRELTVDPEVPAEDGWRNGTAVLSGNVVAAGHGESKPEKVLGSGIAGAAGQTFVLEEAEVAWVPDATLDAGVRAAVTVTVEGRAYRQVSRLSTAGPEDAVYQVRLTEAGFLEIAFGDGGHGRRLPAGANNVRATFRKGTGGGGNLPPGSLESLVKPHRLLDGVAQPLPTAGGNDRERAESLRENAPRGLFALERAVSTEDFARLAAVQSTVWQARAFLDRAGATRQPRVEVVAVFAGGGVAETQKETLRAYLAERALPGVTVAVGDWEPVRLVLDVEIAVVSAAYQPPAVVEAVRAALDDAFALERRGLGEALFRGDLYRVVEAVPGVRRATCLIGEGTLAGAVPRRVRRGNDGTIRVVQPTPRQVVHLADATADLTVTWVEHAT